MENLVAAVHIVVLSSRFGFKPIEHVNVKYMVCLLYLQDVVSVGFSLISSRVVCRRLSRYIRLCMLSSVSLVSSRRPYN